MEERHCGAAASENRAAVAGAEAAGVAARAAVEPPRVDGHRERIGVVAEAVGAGSQPESSEHRWIRALRKRMVSRRLCERRRGHPFAVALNAQPVLYFVVEGRQILVR